MDTASCDRITPGMDAIGVVFALSEGNPGAATVISKWLASSPMAIFEILMLDSKRLYGHRVWELYKDVCGEDLERFRYHVGVELPNQETGQLMVSGPYSPDLNDKDFWTKRSFGQPGSFWALKNPPSERDYEYPIK